MKEQDINEKFSYSKIKARLVELSRVDKVRFSVFCAERVLHIYEDKYKSNKPRLAIDAAKLFIKDPSEENKKKCKTAAAAAADAAYASANAAAYAAANAAAAAAAADAAYAANAAYAAAAAYAAYANDAAYDNAKLSLKEEILSYLEQLEAVDEMNEEPQKPVYTQAMADNGELPPVGANMEFRFKTCMDDPDSVEFSSWFDGEVDYYGEVKVLITSSHEAEGCFWTELVEFRPIKTDQEKLIDELSCELSGIADSEFCDCSSSEVERICNKISDYVIRNFTRKEQ